MIQRTLLRTLSLAPAFVGVLAFGLLTVNANRVVLGVRAGPESLGGQSLIQAEQTVEQRSTTFLTAQVTLEYADIRVNTTPEDLGLTSNPATTVARVWAIGRSGSLPLNLIEQTTAIFLTSRVEFTTQLDRDTFTETLDTLLVGIDEPALDAELVWDPVHAHYERRDDVPGRVVDREPIAFKLMAAVETLMPPRRIALMRVDDVPGITEDDLDQGEALLSELLNNLPLAVQANDDTFRITRGLAGPWLKLAAAEESIAAIFDEQLVTKWLKDTVALRVDRKAQNAVFDLTNKRVTAFVLARDGQELDRPGAVEALRSAILKPASEPSVQTLILPVVVTEPAIGDDAAEELGIKDLLAVGETNFAGSPNNRRHNIGIGVSQYDGLLIAPGEEFSFNQFLGPVTAAEGYKPELVIKAGGTVPEYGGGLCQVSTTAFQGAVKAGFTITKRRNHSYIVQYYGAPGFDATIYPPYTDLKFVNNTPGHILIQTEIVGNIARFYYYGTDDGREVAIDGPRTLALNADGSGSAVLSVTTTYADGEAKTQTFKSYYRSPDLFPVASRNPLE